MHADYYQKLLYPLQDKILDLISELELPFYLTGGTALSRFYLNHRYSDDIDLFINSNAEFRNYINKFENYFLLHKELVLEVINKASDFARFYIHKDNLTLKLDFVNDVPYHYGELSYKGKVKIDHIFNILSNKLSALARYEAKDIVDIIFISLKHNFNWEAMFKIAQEKDTWVNEIDCAEIINTFNTDLLKQILWINQPDLLYISSLLKAISQDIVLGRDNSLTPTVESFNP